VLLVAAGWWAWAEWTARAALARATAALDADDAPTASRLLADYLARRPDSAGAHFRAGQAARRTGDLRGAADHLEAAERAGWAAGDVELERALVRAQSGDLRPVEQTLSRAVDDGHPDARHVLAVLVPALMAEFRWPKAGALAERWTELQPGSARAWALRGEVAVRLRKKSEAVSALREAARLDPEDRATRFRLAQLLLEVRQDPEEAAAHLEWLREADPGNTSVLVQLAVCREGQGRPDEAVALLDTVIGAGTADSKAYYHRGRLESNRGRPAAALPFLRRAAELDPGDVETLHALFLCARQAGTPDEARRAEERWKQAAADLQRVADLARAIAAAPADPDLRREMGELFLRNGRETEGLRWLGSALREQPDHAPTHETLAEYYDRTGRPDLAAHHRSWLVHFRPGGR
jgi:tetratricopeptide (TPR) repeat protein